MLLSVAIIVKNEEDTIERLLDSCEQFADEIIIVDTGSTDDTIKRIEERNSAELFHFEWCDDFAAARNFAFSKCNYPFVMWLDADDVVTHESCEYINFIKNTVMEEEGIAQISMPYHLCFDTENNCTFMTIRERILNVKHGGEWVGAIHEYYDHKFPEGKSIELSQIPIEHRPVKTETSEDKERNLRILNKLYTAGDRQPRTLFYLANENRDHDHFEDAIKYYDEYIAVSNCYWEKYQALLNKAACEKQLGGIYTGADHVRTLLLAVSIDPTRAEAWVELGDNHYSREEFAQASVYYAAAVNCPLPKDGFIRRHDYDWRSADQLSVCYYRIGKTRDAIDLLIKTYGKNPDKERLKTNMSFFLDEVGKEF